MKNRLTIDHEHISYIDFDVRTFKNTEKALKGICLYSNAEYRWFMNPHRPDFMDVYDVLDFMIANLEHILSHMLHAVPKRYGRGRSDYCQHFKFHDFEGSYLVSADATYKNFEWTKQYE